MKARILIVDDEHAIVEVLHDILVDEGYEVAVAFNGEQGLAQARKLPPDLVLLDLMMPVMDGHTMLEQLRQTKELRRTHVIVMSAGRGDHPALGDHTEFIAKPFEVDELLRRVNALPLPLTSAS